MNAKKIRILTICVNPGGGGHVVLWKGIKKHTGINAGYYLNDRIDQNTYRLCQSRRWRTCCVMERYKETYRY